MEPSNLTISDVLPNDVTSGFYLFRDHEKWKYGEAKNIIGRLGDVKGKYMPNATAWKCVRIEHKKLREKFEAKFREGVEEHEGFDQEERQEGSGNGETETFTAREEVVWTLLREVVEHCKEEWKMYR